MQARTPLSIRPQPGRSRRRTIRVDAESLVRIGPPIAVAQIPCVLEATRPDVRLAKWMAGRREWVFELLHRHGALLFRGFPLDEPTALEHVIQALHEAAPATYDYRSTPRSQVAGGVYTSTDYPSDRVIPQHSEQAYSRAFPRALGFLCLTPARRGGATPVADNRLVLARLPAPIRERFERSGVLYVRNYGGPLDLSWREVFQTEDRGEVETYCRENQIEAEWGPDDRLRTRQRCQAVFEHPVTGEAAWFNQAHLFHRSALAAADQTALLEMCGGEDGLPRQAHYGNGEPIASEDLDVVRKAIAAETVRFDWRAGDLLLVDNVLASHGREAFQGDRRVVVCMAGSAKADVPGSLGE